MTLSPRSLERMLIRCSRMVSIIVREDSQIDFFPRNVLWTFGGRGFYLVTFLWPLKISIFHS